MPKDFKASQVRTSKIIGSGSIGGKPGLLIYSASDASNFDGGVSGNLLSNVGSDVFLFVSGAKNDRSGVTLFGGDVVVSGTMYMERMIAEVDLSSTGSASVSGSLFVSSSAVIGGGLIVNNGDSDIGGFAVIGATQNRHMIHANPAQTFVHILSGGAAKSADQTTAVDTAFFVSGTIGARGTTTRGTSVFGGDVVISGSLTDGAGSPITGGGGDTVGWFSGSSAIHNNLGIQPGHISTSGSLAVSGTNLDIAGNIRHIGDTNTAIEFGTSDINLKANNQSLVRALKDGSTNEGVFVGISGQTLGTMVSGGSVGSHMIIPASKKQFLFMSGGAAASIDQADGRDVVFHVSGAIGSKGTTSRGTAVFAGDTVVSGSLFASKLSGSLQNLEDGTPYLAGSGSVKVTSGADGKVTITGDGGGWHRDNTAPRVYLKNTDDRIMIGGNPANSAPSGKLEINVKPGENITGLFIDYNNTDANSALVVESESTDAIGTKLMGFKGLQVQQTKNGGYAAEFTRDRNEAGSSPLVNVLDNNTANQQTALRVRQDGTGDILRLSDGSVEVARFKDGGRINFGHDHETQDATGEGTDVRLFVSGTSEGKARGTAAGVAVMAGDVVFSGSVYGQKINGINNFRELSHVTDIVTFSNTGSRPNISNEVYFFVSGSTPSGFSPLPSKALFAGDLVTSGNIAVVQNYAATGAQLSLNNLTSLSHDGGSVRIDMLAGESLQNGDNVKLFIQKSPAVNPEHQGGPYANIFRGGSGSMLFVVGATESEYKGNQPFVFRDMHNTVFMATTGSAQLGNSSIHFLSGGSGNSPLLQGRDTNFTVSGAIGSAGGPGVNMGTALFGGDLVVSGALQVKNGTNTGGSISGSIHMTSAGRSYLMAGSGVTITSASDGTVTIGASGGGGGSATFVSGSTSVGSVTSIDVSRLGLLMDLGSNQIAITGTIGDSEDGTYTDGLFTSFNSNTRIGHAIDKINEVLFYLSPSPAPNLNRVGTDGLKGFSPVLLSIAGTNLGGSSFVPVTAGAGLGSAVGVNGTYQVATASNNIRMGVFNNLTVIEGDLADNVAQNAYANGIINHSGSAFGDADAGSLVLEINGTNVSSTDLTNTSTGAGKPGFGTGTSLTNNSGFFNLSNTGSAIQSNGQEFGLFKYRTGKFRVGTGGGYQRSGWNYARVVHSASSGDIRATNYIEWFVDNAGTTPKANQVDILGVTLSGSKYISGIQYATGAHGNYVARIDNFYDHVYAANPISFTTSNVNAIGNQTVPSVDASTAGSYNDVIPVTASFQVSESSINAGTMASGTVSFNFSVAHPTKTDMVNTGSIVSSEFLIYSASSLANNQFEDFVYEDKRLISGTYPDQSSVTTATAWSSVAHLTSSTVAGQSDGLAFYKGQLKAPSQTTAQGGNFTIFDGSFALDQGVGTNQPNYSTGGAATGKKTLFRSFRNESGGDVRSFKLCMTGTSTNLVPTYESLSSANVRVYVKNPQTTGWMDLGQQFTPIHVSGSFQVLDYQGAYIGTPDFSFSTNEVNPIYGTFGSGTLANNAYMVVKIEADAGWTGNFEGMDVTFPGFNEGGIVAAPALDEIDISTPSDFVSAKLSFGAGKSSGGPANYINVTGSSASGGPYGVGSDVNFNESYTQSVGVGSNKRYGVNSSNGSVEDVVGNLNGDVTANVNNYTADAFRNAHFGTLSLYVNASGSGVTPVHTVNLQTFPGAGAAGSGTGTSVNANGSGFINMSVPTPASSSDGLADFQSFFRTGKFKVAGADQNAKGWNWARVVHSYGGVGLGDEVTTFVEWVNDDDGNAIDIAASESGSFGGLDQNYNYQSGVKYFSTVSGNTTGTVKYKVSDAYTNVYSSDSQALQFTTLTNVSANRIFVTGSAVIQTQADTALSSNGTTLPPLTSGGDVTADIHVTGTLSYTGGTSLPLDSAISGSQTFTSISPVAILTAKHPIDSNSTRTVTIPSFLAYSGTIGSSNINTTEKFTGEYFRMQSGSFDNQSASGSLKWDATESLVGADAGHNSGLLVYGYDGANGYLVSPKKSSLPNAGDFRTFNDLTSPEDNVNYSGTSGEKHYFRTFKNNTTSDQAVVTINLKGNATLVPRTGTGSASLGSNTNIHVFAKIPGKTGWLDIAKPADGSTADGAGGLQGDRDANVRGGSGASNELTFSTAFVGGDPSSNGSGEHFCLAIHADAGWTGFIEEILVTF